MSDFSAAAAHSRLDALETRVAGLGERVMSAISELCKQLGIVSEKAEAAQNAAESANEWIRHTGNPFVRVNAAPAASRQQPAAFNAPRNKGEFEMKVAQMVAVAALVLLGGYGLYAIFFPRQEVAVLTVTPTTTAPVAVAARQLSPTVWVESGGHQPTAIPRGLTLVKGHPGDPDCVTLPNGQLRCPNHWVVLAKQ